jgi:hypothetical protein
MYIISSRKWEKSVVTLSKLKIHLQHGYNFQLSSQTKPLLEDFVTWLLHFIYIFFNVAEISYLSIVFNLVTNFRIEEKG